MSCAEIKRWTEIKLCPLLLFQAFYCVSCSKWAAVTE